MRIGIAHDWADPRQRARLVAFAAILFGTVVSFDQLGTLVLPWWHRLQALDNDTPSEICTALLMLSGFGLAAWQAWRHRADAALGRGWSLAAIGTGLVAANGVADWFNAEAVETWWSEQIWVELPVWLISVLCLARCVHLYGSQAGVKRWFRIGVAMQVAFSVLAVLNAVLDPIDLGEGDILDGVVDHAGMLAALCYLSALLMCAVSPATLRPQTRRARAAVPGPTAGSTAPAGAGSAVGALARMLYYEHHLYRAPRYPTRFAILHRQGFRQATTLVMAALYWLTIGPQVWRAGFVSLMRQGVDLIRLGMTAGVDAVSYYLYELYRPGGDAQSEGYLTRYETKNGLLATLNRASPDGPQSARALTDKAIFNRTCTAADLPTPPILLAATDGTVTLHAPIHALDRDLFVKLMRGRGTKQTAAYRRAGPWTYLDRNRKRRTIDDVVEHVRHQSLALAGRKTTPVIVQPRLYNHPALADLADESLIAIRVVTCLDREGRPQVTHGLLRVLTKIEPAWETYPDTEYGAAIDIATGRLSAMTGDKPQTCLAWYDEHPITGVPVRGRLVPHWEALCALAERAHTLFPGCIVIGWDLALTADGPVLLEGNSNMDVSFIQRACREPIGRNRLGDLLAFHLARLCT